MAQPSETTGWNSSGSNRTEPTSGKKATGWIVDEKPASSYANWLFATIEAWLVWVQGIYNDAATWTQTQSFNAAAAGNGTGITAAAGIASQALSLTAAALAIHPIMTIVSQSAGDALDISFTGGSGSGNGIGVSTQGGIAGQFSSTANVAMFLLGNLTHAPLKLLSSGAPSSPDEGEIYLDSGTGKLNFYYSGAWHTVTSS